MHAMTIPASVKAIGRAGAGTNNIPVAAMSKRGVPVFNAPGANANAVKELVLAALLMAARNSARGARLRRAARSVGARPRGAGGGRQEAVRRASSCRTARSAIIGLGAIGSLVADTAIKLGMKVTGYDPDITVDAAWRLPSTVRRAHSIDEVLKHSDFVTLHVPLVAADAQPHRRAALRADEAGRGAAQLRARRHRGRRRRAGGAACAEAALLHDGLPGRRACCANRVWSRCRTSAPPRRKPRTTAP